MTRPDDPFIHPPPADPPTGRYYWAKWAAHASVAGGVLQPLWTCGPASLLFQRVHASAWTTDPHGFVLGRLVLLMPTLAALVFSGIARFGRRPGAYRGEAAVGLFIATGWLLLFAAMGNGRDP